MKKFYKVVDVVQCDSGYCVTLDDKTIKTPAGALLAMPSKALAQNIASEWNDITEGEEIKPQTMGYMQLASTAIDKVLPNMHEVSHNLMQYAMNDLLCYRSGDNLELRTLQDKAWDKWIYWAKENSHIDLIVGEGIVPINQSPAVKANALLELNKFDGFKLTVMADLTAIYGSFVLGLAVMQGAVTMLEAYEISRTDELYQIAQWGIDAEAEQSAEQVRIDLKKTEKFLSLL